jgi:hypothetical protein
MIKFFRFILIIGFSFCFFLFSAWWYGLFSDIGKSYRFYHFDLDEVDRGDYRYFSDEEIIEYQKKTRAERFPKMTAAALIDSLCYWSEFFANELYWYLPFGDGTIEEKGKMSIRGGEGAIADDIMIELSKRNNAGKELLYAYQNLDIEFDTREANAELVGSAAVLELLLSRPDIQQHLTADDKALLSQLADQKQAEKFLNPLYSPDHARKNYLYTDSYDRIHSPYKSGWKEHILEGRAKQLSFLRENNKVSREKKLTQLAWQKALKSEQYSHLSRFDNCQVTQP